ncbi:hypothetical protein [Vulcanisaeta sp. JCM 16159]|uniref:hypothetical protein n=1 Tax=Vulcanisaeta sp. JCM 16159 TaxID=1295371 RepID=UPI000AF52570|nr:hypothetical protein [Vulcanisaeta sp. JCM 16159]
MPRRRPSVGEMVQVLIDVDEFMNEIRRVLSAKFKADCDGSIAPCHVVALDVHRRLKYSEWDKRFSEVWNMIHYSEELRRKWSELVRKYAGIGIIDCTKEDGYAFFALCTANDKTYFRVAIQVGSSLGTSP